MNTTFLGKNQSFLIGSFDIDPSIFNYQIQNIMISECGSTLYVGMVLVVLSSLYICIGVKF